jgi:hypothetical protein
VNLALLFCVSGTQSHPGSLLPLAPSHTGPMIPDFRDTGGSLTGLNFGTHGVSGHLGVVPVLSMSFWLCYLVVLILSAELEGSQSVRP